MHRRTREYEESSKGGNRARVVRYCLRCGSELTVKRKHYVCHACGAILRRYGQLVTVEFEVGKKRYIVQLELLEKLKDNI